MRAESSNYAFEPSPPTWNRQIEPPRLDRAKQSFSVTVGASRDAVAKKLDPKLDDIGAKIAKKHVRKPRLRAMPRLTVCAESSFDTTQCPQHEHSISPAD